MIVKLCAMLVFGLLSSGAMKNALPGCKPLPGESPKGVKKDPKLAEGVFRSTPRDISNKP